MKYELHGIGEKAHTIHIEYIARSWLWATMAMQNGKKKEHLDNARVECVPVHRINR